MRLIEVKAGEDGTRVEKENGVGAKRNKHESISFSVEDDHYCRNESEVDYGALKENGNVHEIGGRSGMLNNNDKEECENGEYRRARKIELVDETPIDENVGNGPNKHLK
ncbi:7923_t:CDS:2 [Racocetra persica]|uniref:7923_t:CDS:1 n=1 Tax=Racocetra persica TaxID=160502 RepID=A0ACA9LX58_9GLOM|nr:7923_t:CDS:2 [Racocetra persica]